MKRRNEKSTGLRPYTLERLLRFNNKHAVEVSGIYSFFKKWLLLSDELVKAMHSFVV